MKRQGENMQRKIPNTKLLLMLIAGIVVGFSFSQLLYHSNCLVDMSLPLIALKRNFLDDEHENEYLEPREDFDPAESPLLMAKHSHQGDNNSLAQFLYNETRVLCWVLTGPANHKKKAMHVKNTWGSRCNKLIFMSSEEDQELGAIKLPVAEGRGNLWHKTREAMKYVYDHHFDEADWFLKADDDTYVIAENLRSFLYQFSPEAPVYFGCKFKPMVRQGYMSGGAGYVLSKEALRRFIEKAYPNSKLCKQSKGGAEDKEMGTCLQNVGVVAGDSRDEMKRGRFFPSAPQGHIIPKDKKSWYWRYIFYATDDGLDCCSDHAISFHYISPSYFYVLDYLIYHLRPFGVVLEPDRLPAKANMTELLEKWRKEPSDNPK